MVFNATFNNISIISWWSVLLVEETGIPGFELTTRHLLHMVVVYPTTIQPRRPLANYMVHG